MLVQTRTGDDDSKQLTLSIFLSGIPRGTDTKEARRNFNKFRELVSGVLSEARINIFV